MKETIVFHFEGALADSHRLNFYESSRFQYAAARLLVKLSSFRRSGNIPQKITPGKNTQINLVAQAEGSFNLNVEDIPDEPQKEDKKKSPHFDSNLSDLIAYVAEKLLKKIGDDSIGVIDDSEGEGSSDFTQLDQLAQDMIEKKTTLSEVPQGSSDLVRRRVAEISRERRLSVLKDKMIKLDAGSGPKLVAMSAPLMSEMATILRTSAETMEVRSTNRDGQQIVFYLNKDMAEDIEVAIVDEDITDILGDIEQFNKVTGWGKIKIRSETNENKVATFNIPRYILSSVKKELIDNMKRDLVYLKAFFVRDQAGEMIRMIVVEILPTPTE
ncbi:hypothetical protein EOD42_17165 [Rhodovarius crocodyli]|uniref:Uncharacterized protein n=1 Tax=Rhodovarius crocodyli TaxID=1979269 RepID=A0A437MCM2_9PROT|nr:hypothetical protein [Rhodovarius crocodyli]RVT95313.1 hypothetical protein EOD42_17165 [Rhodovarius crocodyli]